MKITEFLKDSKNLSQVELNDELLVKVAKKLRELHSHNYQCKVNFDPFKRLEYYLESNKNPHRDLYNYITKKIKKYYDNTELIMCHNDLVPGNILITNEGDIKIIDFEYASNNHPFFDVISFLSENDITDENQIKLFISTYYDNKLPDNIETWLTAKGTNISGGQKQRLFIARALANNPRILILDDSSSALDYKTDSLLRKEIKENYNCTMIIVAQRISSIKHCDLILVLEDGKIVGKGNHEFLMQNSPIYNEIYQSQMGGGINE